ncbi:unnamed protein product [Vicia faba]|uniref:Uncharacterized protein n=1 Tax=Vicia faba TaxID=3906 RepID=A0AAV0ZCB2_VICFA|nr:unnamed protein product [Vicia faba]
MVGGLSPCPLSFNLWDSFFDSLRFMYDFLNIDENVDKVKVVGAQKLTQNIYPHLLNSIMLYRALFEVSDSFEKNVVELKKKRIEVKEYQYLKDVLVASINERMAIMEKELQELRADKQLADAELGTIQGEMSELKGQLAEKDKEHEVLNGKLEVAVMDILLARDQGFNKAKQRALFLHLDFNLSALGYFKVI